MIGDGRKVGTKIMHGNGKSDKICGFIEEAKYHASTSCPGAKYDPKYSQMDT